MGIGVNQSYIFVEDEVDNPFAGRKARRECPFVPSNTSRWESRFKLDIPEIQGCLQSEEFLDWVATVEEVLDFKMIEEFLWWQPSFGEEPLHGGNN